MERLLFTLVMALPLVFTSCSDSNEDKAKKLINHNLKVTLNDPDGYESVEFGTLDSIFSNVYDLPEYTKAARKARDFEAEINSQRQINDYVRSKGYAYLTDEELEEEEERAWSDSAQHYKNICIDIERSFVPELTGWSMTHTFRTKNAIGSKIINSRKYYFDKEITKVVESEFLY